MSYATSAADRNEEAILNYEISDDALERAAGVEWERADHPTKPFAIICIPFIDREHKA